MTKQDYKDWSTEVLQETAETLGHDIEMYHGKIKNIELDLAAMHKLSAQYQAELARRHNDGTRKTDT